MSLSSETWDFILERYAAGEKAKDIAADYDISPHSIRRRASLAGGRYVPILTDEAVAAWGRNFETRARTSDVETENEPPAFTRRCRNQLCIERFVPVNSQHWYHEPACRESTQLWTAEEILAEEGALLPESSHFEMVKRAFGQKAALMRRVTTLTSQREYFRFEFEDLLKKDPGYRLPPMSVPRADGGKRSERQIIVLCSDWQLGKLENGVGVEVVQRRVGRIADATEQIVAHFRASGHPVDTGHIVFAGDMLEGCYIYGGQNVSGLDRTGNTHRLTRQVYEVAGLEAQLAMRLAGTLPNVIAHSVPGNHGRPNGRNDFADPEDNLDTLASWWAKDKSATQANLHWDISEDWWQSFDVLGYKVVAQHGDAWRGPLSQLEKLLPSWVLSNMFGGRPDLFLTAHRHNFCTFDLNGVTVIQNGTIDGGSNYFTKATGKASRPTQTVIVMSEKRGCEAIYPIYADLQ